MASKWASSILQRVAPIGYDLSDDELMEAIDTELQEVREVLYQLISRPMPDGSYCWCNKSVTAPDHAPRCQRARSLYQRLSEGE